MILDQFRLDDRVAIISGASRGIGAGIAKAFAEVGANVVIGARSEETLGAVAGAVEALGRQAEMVAGDLSSREGMAKLVDRATETFGRIDIVVNNTGGSAPSAFLDTGERDFNAAFKWNVTTAYNLTQLATPLLLESPSGNVINIASTAGVHASRGFAAYGVAKGAMIKLTRHLAADLSPKVRVNAIAPGAIRTDALKTVLNDELETLMADGTPLKRIGEVDDIAAAAVYLASDAASYVTGRVLQVDGGIEGSNLEMGMADL